MSLTSGSLSKRGTLLRRVTGSQSLLARFLRGLLWLLLNDSASRGLQFLALIVAARWLSKADFGLLGAVVTTMALFQNSISLGLSDATTKFISQYYATDAEQTGALIIAARRLAWIVGLSSALGLLVGAEALSKTMIGDPSLSLPLRVTAATVVFTMIGGNSLATLIGHQKFRTASAAGLAGGVTSFIGITVGSWADGVLGAAIGMMSGAATTAIIAWRLTASLRVISPIRPVLIRAALGRLVAFAVPSVLSTGMTYLGVWLSNVLVARFADIYALGLLTAVNQIRSALLLLPLVMMRVTLPFLSNAAGRDAKGEFESVERLTTRLTVISIIPLCGFFAFMPEVLLGLFGEHYADGKALLSWFLVSIMIQSAGLSVGPVLQATNRAWVGFWIGATFLTLFSATQAFLLPRYGVDGAGIGMIITFFLLTIGMWIVFWKLRLCSSRRLGQAIVQMVLASSIIPMLLFIPQPYHQMAALVTMPLFVVFGLMLTDFKWRTLRLRKS